MVVSSTFVGTVVLASAITWARAAGALHERISERSEAIDQEKERISARSQLIRVPKISCRDSDEMVNTVLQERSSERMCESPDQLWQRTVEQYLNLDACVGHAPSARALVCKRLRERCEMVWPQLGGGPPSFSCEH